VREASNVARMLLSGITFQNSKSPPSGWHVCIDVYGYHSIVRNSLRLQILIAPG